jgi:hypothetical protein
LTARVSTLGVSASSRRPRPLATRQEGLRALSDWAKYDASCASSGARRAVMSGDLGNNDGTGICHRYTLDGGCASHPEDPALQLLLYDCVFCVNRVGNGKFPVGRLDSNIEGQLFECGEPERDINVSIDDRWDDRLTEVQSRDHSACTSGLPTR